MEYHRSVQSKNSIFTAWDKDMIFSKVKNIGAQCELVWDFSKIKVDALWIKCSFIVNSYTFCRIVVMNVE